MTASPLIIVMGVSGSGKSTIGTGLARELGISFIEGDSLHSQSNVAKLTAGIPLTDEDRWPWFREIAEALLAEKRAGRGAVASCSALKRVYRDWFTTKVGDELQFVFLDGSRELLATRLAGRLHHFIAASLLESQLDTLERPKLGEALTLDISQLPEELVAISAALLVARPTNNNGL